MASGIQMLIHEISARFQKTSDTAWLDGKPANPKKVLGLMQRSLNKYTGFNWKMTPTRIGKKRYYGEFDFEGTTIEIQVSWEDAYGSMESTIDRPAVVCVNPAAHDRNVFLYYWPMETEKIKHLFKAPAAIIIDAVEGRRKADARFAKDSGMNAIWNP